MDNSANYTVIPEEEMNWFTTEVSDADFVLVHTTMYATDNDRIMGVVEGEVVSKVKEQADEILTLVRGSNVKAIISGDRHLFSEIEDPVRKSLKHIVLGALTESRNVQTPRFAVLELGAGGGFEVKEVVLE